MALSVNSCSSYGGNRCDESRDNMFEPVYQWPSGKGESPKTHGL